VETCPHKYVGYFYAREQVSLTAAQAAELRRLTQVTFLFCSLDEAAMLALLQPSEWQPPLLWAELPHQCMLTDAVGELLASLVHITRFESRSVELHPCLRSLRCLSLLPALTEVDISTTTSFNMLLEFALEQPEPHSQVQILSLRSLEASTKQLTAVLSYFPRLRELTLDHITGYDAYTFVQPLRHTLRRLLIEQRHYSLSYYPPTTVEQLAVLEHLTEIKVPLSFILPDAALALLEVPSSLLPSLCQRSF
jgi:hypothetical protein